MNTCEEAFTEAKALASIGEEYSHLISNMDHNQALMLKHHVLRLPQEIAEKTIYGRVVWNNSSVNKMGKK